MSDELQSPEVRAYLDRLYSDPVFFVSEVFAAQRKAGWALLGEVENDAIAFTFTPTTRRRGVLAFRNAGKTHWGSICLALYRLFRDPNRKVIIVSKSANAARETMLAIRNLMADVWFLRHLLPREGQRDNLEALDVGPAQPAKQPSIKALGIEGQLAHNRAHTVVADDVETEGNSQTPEARQRLELLVTEFTAWLYEDRPEGNVDGLVASVDPVEIVYFGTPKHEETLYNKLGESGTAFRAYPICLPGPEEQVKNLAPLLSERIANGAKPGEPTCPHRFNRLEVADRMSVGRHVFLREYMLISNLADSNRYPMRLSDIIVHSCDKARAPVSFVWGTRDHNGSTDSGLPTLGPTNDRLHRPVFIDAKYAPYNAVKAGIDPSGKGKDRTGLSIAGELAGFFHLMYNQGLDGRDTTEVCDQIAKQLRTHGVTEAYFEQNIDAMGLWEQVMLQAIRTHTLQPGQDPLYPQGWTCSLTPVPSHAQKETRIIAVVEPLLSQHRLIVDPTILQPTHKERELEFQFQLACMTRDRGCLTEDGRIDSLAILLRSWLENTSTVVMTTGEKRGIDKQHNLDRMEEERNAYLAELERRPLPVDTFGGWISNTDN